MKKILITGFNGFIATDIREKLAEEYKVMGIDLSECSDEKFEFIQSDFTDKTAITNILTKSKPDVIIHCAGIAHQKAGSVSEDEYMRINATATGELAEIASKLNPSVHFIFLSSISVYGEDCFKDSVKENFPYKPTSFYAKSKMVAEVELNSLNLKNLTILRLSPVYDKNFTLNLDRRVFFPKKLFYMKFGKGDQIMSAISRQNLSDFIKFIVENKIIGETINVADKKPYSFNEIMDIFKKTDSQPKRPVIWIPLFSVYLLTRFLGIFAVKNRSWVHACYDKVSKNLVFDNTRMLKTGFKPVKNLRNIFIGE